MEEAVLFDGPSIEVVDNTGQNRFELWLNGDLVGILGYFDYAEPGQIRRPGRRVVSLMHTVITEDFGHRGLAGELAKGALDYARRYGWQVRPVCTYVQRFLAEHPDYREALMGAEIPRAV